MLLVDFSASDLKCPWFASGQLKHEVETCILPHENVSAPLLCTIQEFQLRSDCVEWTSTYLRSHSDQLWMDSVMAMVKASYCRSQQ